MSINRTIGTFVKARPRLAAALAFGFPAAILIHFSWYADARTSGIAPALTVGAGLAHALAGTLVAPRRLNPAQRPISRSGAIFGALASLIALALFAFAFTAYLFLTEHLQTNIWGYVLLNLYTGFFAFLAAGWALFLLSVGVGCALNWIASFGNPT